MEPMALVGATVMPIGGGQGTSTDMSGEFRLSVPDNVKILQVSYVDVSLVRHTVDYIKRIGARVDGADTAYADGGARTGLTRLHGYLNTRSGTLESLADIGMWAWRPLRPKSRPVI